MRALQVSCALIQIMAVSATSFEQAVDKAGKTIQGMTPCYASENYCIAMQPFNYAADMPSKHPSWIDTIPTMTKPPNVGQSVLPMVSAANTVHPVTAWKCDAMSDSSATLFESLSTELTYAFLEAGNRMPACIPVPMQATESIIESVWMRLGYWLKKFEQASWAVYYASIPMETAAEYLAEDSFFLWSTERH